MEVFSFVLSAQTPAAVAFLTTKIQKNTIYKIAKVPWYVFCVVGVVFGFPSLYFACSPSRRLLIADFPAHMLPPQNAPLTNTPYIHTYTLNHIYGEIC